MTIKINWEALSFPTSPELREVLQAVWAKAGVPMIVGGAVRDHLLGIGHDSKDIDIEVYRLTPEELEAAFASDRFKVNAVGKSFGVLKVKVGDSEEEFDVSLPRHENKAGRGHKGFVATPDPFMLVTDAAARRDFTINAMGYNPRMDEFVDPFGGRKDLEDRVLRMTSPHFSEDPLRVLRACQFAARFEMKIATSTLTECLKLKDELPTLPKERLWEEWKKLLLKSEKPSIGIDAMRETGVLEVLFPELQALIGIPQEYAWHPEGWSVAPARGPLASLPDRLSVEIESDERRVATSLSVLTNLLVAGTAHPPGLMWSVGPLAPATDEGFWVVVPVSLPCMRRVVDSANDDFQVLQSVVGPVSVFVMDMLFPAQAPAEFQFHEDAMKTNGPVASGPTGVEIVSVLAETSGSSVDRHVTLAFRVRVVGDFDLSHVEPVYHASFDQSLWVHNQMVTDEAAKIIRRDGLLESDPEEALIVMLGAMCHDLGKPSTTKFENGRWRSLAHDTAGVPLTESLLARMGCPPSIAEQIPPLVANHLAPSTFYKAKSGNGAIRRLALKVPLERLVRVAEADHQGRTTPDVLAGKPYEAGAWLLEKASNLDIREEGPKPYLLGRHLLAMGFKPGPALGKMLKEAFEAQMDDAFTDEHGAIEWAKSRFGASA